MIDMTTLTPNQIKALTTAQVASITLAQMRDQIRWLTDEQLDALDELQN